MTAKSRSTSVKKVAAEVLGALQLGADNLGAFAGDWHGSGPALEKRSPIDGSVLARVTTASPSEVAQAIGAAERAFRAWRNVPAPQRGELLRRYAEALRTHKSDLGRLVTLETGKILAEGEGEVQEMIDICDFAVGLSRQLYGLTIASERPAHRLMEQWQPLGVVAIVSAFNFPAAVWSWNSVLATVCGDATIWKPSEKTPLTAIACVKLAERVCRERNVDPAIFSLVCGDGPTVGEPLIADARVALVSATGSTRMGRRVSEVVAQRLGRTLLELGGNNAIIVAPSADLKLALRGVLFAAVGTAGQRCTTTRRLIVHESVYGEFTRMLKRAYAQVAIGNPLEPTTLMGPLIDARAVASYESAIAAAKSQGGRVLYGDPWKSRKGDDPLKSPKGGEPPSAEWPANGSYVSPCIIEADNAWEIVQQETFGPILYVMPYRSLEDAIALQNAVPQGLSSAIFTNDVREAELFTSVRGSDCGIANVNMGTSGAEIGGAFGGEKQTGGGRESGTDSWRSYMRRQTVTVNYSTDLPLAQGVRFGE
ncbi:MAG TPA: aldehyde dehydrogenase family protein [Gammaproteobacteria bacterium]|nr:aldehyde dehydrogenase family protein [Gammaproteobacteria bacterium]